MAKLNEHYPTPDEVDQWCDDILQRAEGADLTVHVLGVETWPFRLGVRHTGGTFIRMSSEALGEFYAFWQPCPSGRGPLLVHTPGYGAELSAHPELVADGYNVIHINPLGYGTPDGPDESKRPSGTWPVFGDTARSLGEKGYVDWLSQAALGTLWALAQPEVSGDRYAFFGTSQGGGMSVALGSIFRDRGVRAVAGDVVAFCHMLDQEEIDTTRTGGIIGGPLAEIARNRPDDLPAACKALGYVDGLRHARRLTMPTLVLAGGEDGSCPASTIRTLFDALPGTRCYVEVAGQGHAYTTPFLHMARAWFRLYV